MPEIISMDPIKIPIVNFSPRSKWEKIRPNTGTSKVEIVAVAISILSMIIYQTVKQSADARIPV